MKTQEVKKIILEGSTNEHSTTSNVQVVNEIENMSTIEIVTNGSMIVEHGHHFTVATEKDTKKIIKITQQEVNPLTEKLQNAFD
jgi:hypothetical protein